MSTISTVNIDEATLAEVQKYMEDHGVTSFRVVNIPNRGWFYYVNAKGEGDARERYISGGPLKEMSDCMKAIIHKIEEA